jgi:hypothetical protein
MQAPRERGDVVHTHSWPWRYMGGGEWSASRLYRALSPGMDPRYPFNRRLGGPQSWSGHRGYRKKSFASAADRIPAVQSVARHYTDWATPIIITSTAIISIWFLYHFISLLLSLHPVVYFVTSATLRIKLKSGRWMYKVLRFVPLVNPLPTLISDNVPRRDSDNESSNPNANTLERPFNQRLTTFTCLRVWLSSLPTWLSVDACLH